MRHLFIPFLILILSVFKINGQSIVAYYPFNGNANDESGNGRNPTYNGAGLTTDRFGNPNSAFIFSGAPNGHIEYSSTGLPETNRTIALWFYASDLNSRPTLFSYGGNGCASTLLMAINSSASGSYPSPQYLVSGHCNTNNITYAYTTEPLNEWYHFVLTINGNEQKIYINGELKSTQNTYSGSTYTTERELAFGVATYISGFAPYTDSNLGYFQGKLDDIRIYDGAMSVVLVQQLYENEATGLVAYYPFNGNANDESIHQNHGTVQNAVLTIDRFGNTDKAYSFSNPNHITVPYNPNVFTDAFTLSYWFKIPSYYGDRAVLSCVANPNGGFQQWFTGQTFQYILGYNFPNWFYSNFMMQSPANQWHQMVLTYQKTGSNSSETKLYINGELKTTNQHNLAISYTPGATFYIGQNHGGLNFQGDLDDIKIFNQILNSQQILQNYENEATCSDPLNAVIASPYNSGAGTLRASVQCLESGGTITWSPTTDRTLLTTPITIDKNIIISQSNPANNPEIIVDLLNASTGFIFSSNAVLNLNNVDITVRNHSGTKTVAEGGGSLLVSGYTVVEKDPYPNSSIHCDPAFATEIVDVTNPITGRTWMDRNLGAKRVAINSTDEQSYGDLYQWGRLTDGHQCRNSATTTTNSNIDVPGHSDFILEDINPYDWRIPQNPDLWQGVTGINNPCPAGYRIPTHAEWEAERLSWSSNNAAGAFNSPLKLPVTGNRNAQFGTFSNEGSWGHYWSSSISGSSSSALDFSNVFAYMGIYSRAHGMCIRCIKQ
jgi:uncharacterized protein (TIGR02145 family)